MDGPQEVAADTKEIVDRSVHREKPLRVGSRCESAHLTLPLPGRLVGDVRPIVRVLVRAVDHGRITVRQAAGSLRNSSVTAHER